jgi:glycosyltransferase involved in cell wall biosynthesis
MSNTKDISVTARRGCGDEPALSLVVPLFNEAQNIQLFYKEASAVMDSITPNWEMIFVNDGSQDETLAVLAALHQSDDRIKIVDLSRNFGKEVALSAGIDFAYGDAVIPIDGDLQHPPEQIIEMVDKWRAGADIVFAIRHSRETESWLRQKTSSMFYVLLDGITDVPLPKHIGDFCLLDARVAKILKLLPEQNRFMKGLFAWGGFRQEFVYYEPQARNHGSTKWGYWRLWNLAIEGITSFSTIPLRVWTYIGALLALLCLGYAGFIIAMTLIYGIDAPGYPSLMVAVLFMGSIQLISFGALGEYIGRIYWEVKGRPLYLVNKLYGLDESDQEQSR